MMGTMRRPSVWDLILRGNSRVIGDNKEMENDCDSTYYLDLPHLRRDTRDRARIAEQVDSTGSLEHDLFTALPGFKHDNLYREK